MKTANSTGSPRSSRTALRGRGASWWSRFRLMATTGVAMAFHDRSKSIGTLLGVVFAVVLVNQQLGTFLGLLQKNTMFVDNADCDIWIAPPYTEQLQAGAPLAISALTQARTAPGVQWAEPLAFGAALVARPDGGNEPVTLVGTTLPRMAGGPWNVVAGDPADLRLPDTVFFEDSQRLKLGGVNLGSVRELNGHRVVVGGFTWGLLPFGPAYAFAEYETAREILRLPEDQTHFVLVRVTDISRLQEVKAELQRRIPNSVVLTRQEFQGSIIRYILTATAIGITFGTSSAFGLIVGFVIVALSMFSAVVDNIREFGTLKAMGARMVDLVALLIVQAICYATVGSMIGLFLATRMAEGIRSPELALVLPTWLILGSAAGMVVLCIMASILALLRVRSVEPGMVFR